MELQNFFYPLEEVADACITNDARRTVAITRNPSIYSIDPTSFRTTAFSPRSQ
jgi:hypothetical protein